jgi:hypothetical protein
MGQRAATFVETKVHGDGDATHGADLHIENYQIGCATFDDFNDRASVATMGEGCFGSAKGGDDFVDQPVSIGSEDHMHV